ncbi:hypothetical protein [Halioxenophilus aromaticivorans]|uniref:FAD-dependent monooxygenase n=1 Tax=Halioxenophilus aromaticivorans TaxID=1306992 RepID=A0AAV3TY05_9ALTE
MKITIIGGGPGGLYFALLTKKAKPSWQIDVYEQNKADDTFGFGVVFSDETLQEFLSRDPESYQHLTQQFSYWDDIVIHRKDQDVRCSGNGFCGISRIRLLQLLQDRCHDLGVGLHFDQRIEPEVLETRFADSDIILSADGIGSAIRDHYADHFQPTTEHKSNRFCWMGSTRPLADFTYFFKETEHGLICAHTYQYEADKSTWVFEMSDDCWQKHGFEVQDEAGSKSKLEVIFADELQGHGLILNRSMWRQFPRIFCNQWFYKNIAILGDAKASAHFSIGSGTKLAMECAISFHDAVVAHGERSVDKAFEAYDAARRAPVQIVQHNADVSLAWFEHMERSWDMDAMQFAMVVMCRAKSVTYDNLMLRDPSFVDAADTAWYQRYFEQTGYDYRDSRPTPMFTRFKLRDLELRNRVVMSPMAQYAADDNGNLSEWHYVHYAGHAKGGMGMVVTEMTCPSPDARITQGCPGFWTHDHAQQWQRIVDFVHQYTDTKICLQLGHAGRKGSTQKGWQKADYPIADAQQNWPLVSASPLPWFDGISQVPTELDEQGMQRIIDEFAAAAERAESVGFDMLELHCAHGYLFGSFLSPITNQRSDQYGGAIENRLRFPLAVFEAMRRCWPEHKPMSVRISACDWMEQGITEEDTFAIAEAFQSAGCDLIDVSAGQTDPGQKPIYGRMFQVQFSEAIRNVPKIATMTVGNVTDAAQINTILHTRRADLVAVGRPHLWNPYFTRQSAASYGVEDDQAWEPQYLSGKQQAYRELRKSRQATQELQVKAKARSHAPIK